MSSNEFGDKINLEAVADTEADKFVHLMLNKVSERSHGDFYRKAVVELKLTDVMSHAFKIGFFKGVEYVLDEVGK